MCDRDIARERGSERTGHILTSPLQELTTQGFVGRKSECVNVCARVHVLQHSTQCFLYIGRHLEKILQKTSSSDLLLPTILWIVATLYNSSYYS